MDILNTFSDYPSHFAYFLILIFIKILQYWYHICFIDETDLENSINCSRFINARFHITFYLILFIKINEYTNRPQLLLVKYNIHHPKK